MALETNEVCDNGGSPPIPIQVGVDDHQPSPLAAAVAAVAAVEVEVVDDKSKSPRHPRWTRQETLTLIEGKKVAENRGRRGRRSSSVFGSDQLEPKWDSVASYCKQHAVNRGPVQCRKRWSNMVGDFKKIKAWESQVKQESDSYWVMRNDSRKENKLPGFFDREVFDVLDGKAFTKAAYKLALVTVSSADVDVKEENLVTMVAAGEEEEILEEDNDAVFDSGRRATSADGLFPDTDKMEEEEEENDGGREKDDSSTKKIPDPMPISEKRCQLFHQDYSEGNLKEQQTNSESWKETISHEGSKRRKLSTDECQKDVQKDVNFEARLLEVLEKNTDVLNARIEAENTNCQLDRDQRKDYNDSLVSALNKISDALTKIADKL